MEEKNYQAVSYVRPIFKDLLCPEDDDPSIPEKLTAVQNYLERFPDITYQKNLSDRPIRSQTASLRSIERLIPLFENHICDCLILYTITEFSNYIQETRHCLLELLPSLSVRILSVLESYDSLTSGDAENGYPILKKLLDMAESNENGRRRKNEALKKHDSYRKSESTCPYGYQPAANEGTAFAIDPEAAKNIQRIFREYISGRTTEQIAASLKQENILTRKSMKNVRRDPDAPPSPSNCWSAISVRNILTNEFYTGDLILPGYRNTVYLNSHDMDIYRAAPEMAVRSHHPAIITREEFDTAQLMFNAEFIQGKYKLPRKDRPGPDPYRGLVFCAKCGSAMHHDRRAKPGGILSLVYHCSKSMRQDREACSSKVILFSVVDNAVHTALKKEKLLADTLVSCFEADNSVYRKKEAYFHSEMNRMVQELKESTIELSKYHIDYMAGRISADKYYLKSETLEDTSSRKSEELLKAMTALREFRANYDPASNAWVQLFHGLSLDRPLTSADAKRLIECISISPEDGSVTVKLKCEEDKALFQSILNGTSMKNPADLSFSWKEE